MKWVYHDSGGHSAPHNNGGKTPTSVTPSIYTLSLCSDKLWYQVSESVTHVRRLLLELYSHILKVHTLTTVVKINLSSFVTRLSTKKGKNPVLLSSYPSTTLLPPDSSWSTSSGNFNRRNRILFYSLCDRRPVFVRDIHIKIISFYSQFSLKSDHQKLPLCL